MAALTPDQITQVYRDGACQVAALFSLKNVTAGDTADLSGYFKFIKRAGVVGDTATTIAAVTVTGGTSITVPTGPANDGIWLIAVGVAT